MVFHHLNLFIYKLRIRRYIKTNLKRGFELKDIIRKLEKRKIERKVIDELVNDILNKKTEKCIIFTTTIIILVALFVFIVSLFFFMHFNRNPKVAINLPSQIYDFCENLDVVLKIEDITTGGSGPYFPKLRFWCFDFFGVRRLIADEKFQLSEGDISCAQNDSVESGYECYIQKYSNDTSYFPCGLIYISADDTWKKQVFYGSLRDVVISLNFKRVNSHFDLENFYNDTKAGNYVVIETIYHFIKTKLRQDENTGKPTLGLQLGQAYCFKE